MILVALFLAAVACFTGCLALLLLDGVQQRRRLAPYANRELFVELAARLSGVGRLKTFRADNDPARSARPLASVVNKMRHENAGFDGNILVG